MERIFAKGANIIKGIAKKAVGFADDVLQSLDNLISLIKKGSQSFASFIRQVLDDFFEWLKGLFKNGNIDDIIEDGLKLPIKLVVGKYSKRTFDINNCGGKILNLTWHDAKITNEGIEIVKKHLSRLEYDEWNIRMIERLKKIENGKISITDFDKRFYTHETREFERYKLLGFENTDFKNIPDEVWDNAHAATLEDYKLHEKMKFEDKEIYSLFHPYVQY